MTEQALSGPGRKLALRCKPEIHPTDRAGEALLIMLKEAAKLSDDNRERLMDITHDLSRQLQVAQDRIDQLQEDVAHFRSRAASAEKWLETIEKEIEQTLLLPWRRAGASKPRCSSLRSGF